MHDETTSSCWGITGWAIAGFLALIAISYVFGISDTGSVQAAATQVTG